MRQKSGNRLKCSCYAHTKEKAIIIANTNKFTNLEQPLRENKPKVPIAGASKKATENSDEQSKKPKCINESEQVQPAKLTKQ